MHNDVNWPDARKELWAGSVVKDSSKMAESFFLKREIFKNVQCECYYNVAQNSHFETEFCQPTW